MINFFNRSYKRKFRNKKRSFRWELGLLCILAALNGKEENNRIL
jgi:hypothetical protein